MGSSTITVIVPCFNEEETVPLLRNVLEKLIAELQDRHEVELLFVDDGSTDRTRELLYKSAPALGARVLVHEKNLGIAAAFRTGFGEAHGSVICTIDADCTFDPMELVPMITQLESSGADIVVASPYHPEGVVEGVPAWRLILSRAASVLYRWILRTDLYSYTACFRVFRSEAAARLEFKELGFLGISEMLINGLLDGMQVLERPMTLRRRVTGISKMNTLRVIGDHLGFMARLLVRRTVLSRQRHAP